MINGAHVREGMRVYGADHQLIGAVERLDDDGLLVNGQRVPLAAVERIEQDGVYLHTSGAQSLQGTYGRPTEGDVRVPVAEERLDVQERPADLGEVQLHKSVTEERQSVPVDLRRENVRVEYRDVPDRPLAPGEAATTLQGDGPRVPVWGEEAVVRKKPVVTEEVAVQKQPTTERQQVGGTVRKEHVEVDEAYPQARDGRQPAQVPPQAAAGVRSRPEPEAADRVGVVGADRTPVGRMKEAREGASLPDRTGEREGGKAPGFWLLWAIPLLALLALLAVCGLGAGRIPALGSGQRADPAQPPATGSAGSADGAPSVEGARAGGPGAAGGAPGASGTGGAPGAGAGGAAGADAAGPRGGAPGSAPGGEVAAGSPGAAAPAAQGYGMTLPATTSAAAAAAAASALGPGSAAQAQAVDLSPPVPAALAAPFAVGDTALAAGQEIQIAALPAGAELRPAGQTGAAALPAGAVFGVIGRPELGRVLVQDPAQIVLPAGQVVQAPGGLAASQLPRAGAGPAAAPGREALALAAIAVLALGIVLRPARRYPAPNV